MHGISLSQEHLINLNSCTGAKKVPSGTVVGIKLLNNLDPSPRKLAIVMVGLAPEQASR